MFRNRASWLDHFVYSFQHRWETNAQYRAAVSGFVGLALVVTMCACTGVVSAATSSVIAGIGLGGGTGTNQGGGTLNTGTNQVTGAKQFAIPTQVWTPGVVPAASPLPNSQTPAPTATIAPTPTDTPTPLPCTANCGGGGGYSVQVKASYSPSVWVSGQTATIYINTHHNGTPVANVQVGYIIYYPSGATVPAEPAGYTDGNGNATYTVQVPACSGTVQVAIFADGAAGPGVAAAGLSPTCR